MDVESSGEAECLVTLFRHGKSSWSNQDLKDHDRPLNDRGFRDVPIMGQILAQLAPLPTIIVTSSAVRTVQTTTLLCAAMGISGKTIRTEKALYLASPATLSAIVNSIVKSSVHLLVVGHNPGLSEYCRMLDDASPDGLPTAAFCQYRLDLRERSEETRARLTHWNTPKRVARQAQKRST